MLANQNLDAASSVLAPRGRVVVVGSRGRVEIDPAKDDGQEAAVLGTAFWTGNGSAPALARSTKLWDSPSRRVSHASRLRDELPLADASRAHERAMRRCAHGTLASTRAPSAPGASDLDPPAGSLYLEKRDSAKGERVRAGHPHVPLDLLLSACSET